MRKTHLSVVSQALYSWLRQKLVSWQQLRQEKALHKRDFGDAEQAEGSSSI
jgi:hypothetical protein